MDALHLSQPKKKARTEGAIIVHEDEASFRQSPTLHQTWAALNSQPQVPTRGQRNSQKLLAAVDIADGRFAYRHQTEYFNAASYIEFLEHTLVPSFYRRNHRVYLIQDNASYHKKSEVYEWFSANRRRLEVYLLPPYSPQFNAVERIWHYTRMQSTHNRYFDTPEELCQSLFATFDDIQCHPEKILGFLKPFS